MAVDRQIQMILNQYAKYQVPPLEMLSPQAAREAYLPGNAVEDVVAAHVTNRMMTLVTPMPQPVDRIQHHVADVGDRQMMLRIYYPKAEGPLPGLIYFHGGGFVIADLNSYDASCRALCNAAECAVISVAYRRAPENKFPAAVDDAYDVTHYLQHNASILNIDPMRLAIGGESAGANLATVTAIQLRDRGEPLPAHQLLIYPVVNFASESPSYREHANAQPLNVRMMQWFKKHYLRSAEDANNPLASPLLAPSLAGLPPVTLIAAENDPLQSEGRWYADKLEQAGVPVSYTLYEGSTHEFFGMGGVVGIARDAVKKAAEELQAAFSHHLSAV